MEGRTSKVATFRITHKIISGCACNYLVGGKSASALRKLNNISRPYRIFFEITYILDQREFCKFEFSNS